MLYIYLSDSEVRRRQNRAMGREKQAASKPPAIPLQVLLPHPGRESAAPVEYYDPTFMEDSGMWDAVARYDAHMSGQATESPEQLRPRTAAAAERCESPTGLDGIVALCKHVLRADELCINTSVLDPAKKGDIFQEVNVMGASMPRDLPVFSRDHETKLLVQAHRHQLPGGRFVEMRPCIYGEQCIGMKDNFPGHAESGGVILREALTPIELAVFERSGTLPEQRRPCVLCSRDKMTTAFLWCESEQRLDSMRNCILNWYINPRDCDKGYKSEHMIPREGSSGWHCMCGSVCMVVLHKMRLVQSAETGVWHVRQDELEWRAPATVSLPGAAPAAGRGSRKRARGAVPPPPTEAGTMLF